MIEEPGRIEMMLLDTGAIIIGYLICVDCARKEDNHYLIKEPAIVLHERPHGGVLGFTLMPWLPSEILAMPMITLDQKTIVGMMEPSVELLGFYTAWAEVERDKLASFALEYKDQINDIKKYYVESYQDAKKRKVIHHSHPQSNDMLLALFEEDLSWGNPKITH